jgi:hypothetical protein
MTTIIVHDRGEPWNLSLPSLRQRLGCPASMPDPVDFAVEVRGFVALKRRGPATIEMRYRPSIVRPVAMAKAAEVLGACEGVRVVVESSEDGVPFLGGRERSIAHAMARASDAQSKRANDFLARRQALSTAALDAEFGRILDAWHASSRARSAHLMQAVRAASASRYLEVVPNYASGRLVIAAIGEGYSLYGDGWKSVAIGGRFEDMPDFEYARWAAKGYRDALRVREPILEEIAAVADLPRLGRMRLAYRRVILPLGGDDRPTLLLGATLGQKVTRLGLEAGDELGDVAQ